MERPNTDRVVSLYYCIWDNNILFDSSTYHVYIDNAMGQCDCLFCPMFRRYILYMETDTLDVLTHLLDNTSSNVRLYPNNLVLHDDIGYEE